MAGFNRQMYQPQGLASILQQYKPPTQAPMPSMGQLTPNSMPSYPMPSYAPAPYTNQAPMAPKMHLPYAPAVGPSGYGTPMQQIPGAAPSFNPVSPENIARAQAEDAANRAAYRPPVARANPSGMMPGQPLGQAPTGLASVLNQRYNFAGNAARYFGGR